MVYFDFGRSPFLTPASGNTHIEATIRIAVTMTNVEYSGRTGDPLQYASTAATRSAMNETAALTSLGIAGTSFRDQFAPTGTVAASSGRRGVLRKAPLRNRVS